MGEEREVYRFLVSKPDGKRPLGRPKRRCVDNIRTDLQEVGCGYMDWIGLAQDRERWRKLVSAVMNLRVPWNAGNFLTSCKPVSCSRRILHRGLSMSTKNCILKLEPWRHLEMVCIKFLLLFISRRFKPYVVCQTENSQRFIVFNSVVTRTRKYSRQSPCLVLRSEVGYLGKDSNKRLYVILPQY